MPDNVGHVGGFPPTLEGTNEMRIEGRAPGVEDLGGLGTNITWEVVVFRPGLWVLLDDL